MAKKKKTVKKTVITLIRNKDGQELDFAPDHARAIMGHRHAALWRYKDEADAAISSADTGNTGQSTQPDEDCGCSQA